MSSFSVRKEELWEVRGKICGKTEKKFGKTLEIFVHSW